MTKRLEMEVFGRVQFVMFRDFVKRGAQKGGMVGTVKNSSRGTVLITVEGEELLLQKLLERVKMGSLLSRVDRVEERWLQPSGTFHSFSILYE